MIADLFNTLGPGASIAYIGQEPDGWHCELTLPMERYSVRIVTADGIDPDEALQNAVTRARTMFAKEQEGDKAV